MNWSSTKAGVLAISLMAAAGGGASGGAAGPAAGDSHVTDEGRPAADKRPSWPKPYDAVALIPREKLFGNPVKASPQISPDGKRLAYLAPQDGVLNVWVKTIG